MNVFWLKRGGSEQGRRGFQFKWIKSIARLFDAFFGTYAWPLPVEESLASNRVKDKVKVTLPEMYPEPLLVKLSLVTERLEGSLAGKIQVHRNGLQFRRSRRKWSLIKTRAELLIGIQPCFARWRQVIGWRGPPRTLFAAMNTIRLQE